MINSFIQQTARSIINSMDWQQLSRTTFVLPSHRAGIVLKDELLRLQQAQQAQAVWAPQVQTLTQLQDYLSPLYAEDELFTVVRLYKHYRQLTEGNSMSLDQFYNWGRQMLADFTNVDASLPAEKVPNFFDNTIAAHELEQWKLDEDVEERLRSLFRGEGATVTEAENSVRAQYKVLWQQLYELYQSLHAELEAEQKGYPGMRQRAVITHWEDEQIQSKIAGRTYVFVGFNYLLPVERDLMLRLRDNGQAQFYWDFVRDFKTNTKAFSFAQLNAGILGNNCQSSVLQHKLPVTVVSCVSKEAQAQYVHRWLQENYTAKGQKVGVVICDETMLEPVIYTLPAITLEGQTEPEPINITKGFPLRNTAIYAQVMAWLFDRQRGDVEQVLSPEFIDQLLADIFPIKSDDSNDSEPNGRSEAMPWQELLVLESEYQVNKVANQMRRLLTDGLGDVPITLKLLRMLMRRTMESVTMPFHGEPVTDIQVMGVLETRLLDFDRLLLLNVDEGILPQRQADSSFIPFYLRKAYHMQTSDERATVYAYNFFRLLSRSGHTTLLYGQPDTIGGSRGMSRFIMQILYSDEFEVMRTELQEQAFVMPYDDSSFQAKGSYLSTHHHRLSPSALNAYITCPRAFYLQYVEGLHEPEEEETQFASNTLGSFVHHAMEYLYTHYLHCDNEHPVRVLPDEIEAIRTNEDKLQEALMAAYRMMEEREKKVYRPEEHTSENIIIKGYVRNILERDSEDAKVGLQVYLLEQDRRFPVTIDGVGEIQTGGTIDRLDIYGASGNEKLRIVDYKSGNYGDKTHAEKMSATWDEIMTSPDKDYVRQTLIYSHAVMTHDKTGLPIEPNLYFCRRKLTDITTTVDVENEPVHDYKALSETFYEALKAKVKEVMTTTEFPQCEEGKCPKFCAFYRLCGRQPKEF
ncbi:MAG: PD-(D/E)XK nuclease family protein [Paludibacteraceae bacterium]|nr:PD-(D/E)XK nuclease family protein [Paludibacteraceae bacterium]